MHILRFVFFRIVLISSQRVKEPQPFSVRSQMTSSDPRRAGARALTAGPRRERPPALQELPSPQITSE